VFGTVGMSMLQGISVRLLPAIAAGGWALNNRLFGSIAGRVAEGLAPRPIRSPS
jgi:hypothetical protein